MNDNTDEREAPTTVRLPQDLRERAALAKVRYGKSLNELVTRGLELALNEVEKAAA